MSSNVSCNQIVYVIKYYKFNAIKSKAYMPTQVIFVLTHPVFLQYFQYTMTDDETTHSSTPYASK